MKQIFLAFLLLFTSTVFAENVVLCDELTQDPLGRGYSGMAPDAAATDLNTAYRQVFRDDILGSELFEGIEAADWQLISENQKLLVVSLLSFPGSVNPQGNVKTLLISIFGSGSATIANMADISRHFITRSSELGLGTIRSGDVVAACQ